MEGANWEEERESLRSEAESAREARQEAEAELRAVMGDGGPLKVLEGRLQVPCTLARVPRLCDSPPPRARCSCRHCGRRAVDNADCAP